MYKFLNKYSPYIGNQGRFENDLMTFSNKYSLTEQDFKKTTNKTIYCLFKNKILKASFQNTYITTKLQYNNNNQQHL